MERFSEAIRLLPDEWKNPLSSLDGEIRRRVNEIRFRADSPIALYTAQEVYYLTSSGRAALKADSSLPCMSKRDMEEIVFSLSRRSLHTYQDMLARGYLPLTGGNKAGVTGTAVLRNGAVYSVSRFSAVNIRIARRYDGCANELLEAVDGCTSYLIVGQPLSGKTTLLRDLCRYYSDADAFSPRKIALIDERDEIASRAFGNGLAVGTHTDVLSLYPKAVGTEIALRMLSPDIIVLDEIGASDETHTLLSSVNSGVSFIATAHGSALDEVCRRPNIARLLKSGVFRKAVILAGKDAPCRVREVVTL